MKFLSDTNFNEIIRTHLWLLILLHYVTKRQTPPAPLTDETDADGAQVICKGFDDMPSVSLLQEMWKITGREAGHCIKTCLPGFLRGGPRCYHIPEEMHDDWRGDWTMAKELCENQSTAEVTVHLAGKKETKVVVYIVVLEQVQHFGLVDLPP